jgi:hypothetical protein
MHWFCMTVPSQRCLMKRNSISALPLYCWRQEITPVGGTNTNGGDGAHRPSHAVLVRPGVGTILQVEPSYCTRSRVLAIRFNSCATSRWSRSVADVSCWRASATRPRYC